jgi:hypothetical protein
MAQLDDQGVELPSTRDFFPQGLQRAVQTTYRGQAGHAGLLRERLTPELRSSKCPCAAATC